MEIVRADGAAGIYGVVEKTDYAVIVPYDDGRITLVEQFRYPVGARYWEVPQGSWEGHDVDPLALARAELREETGLSAASMTHVGRLFQGYDCRWRDLTSFWRAALSPGRPRLDAEEVGLIARAFALETVLAMIVDGTIATRRPSPRSACCASRDCCSKPC